MTRVAVLVFSLIALSSCYDFGNRTASEVLVDGEPYCRAVDANKKLYSYLNEWYFWNQDLSSDFNPKQYDTLNQSLQALKVPQDRFSFVLSAEEYADYQASRFLGYGFSIQPTENNDGLLLRLVFKESQAYQVGLRRGDVITQINGIPAGEVIADVMAGLTTWAEVFGPDEEGVETDIVFIKPSGTEQSATIVKREIITETVLHHEVRQVANQSVGYLVFNSFKENSKDELDAAFQDFNQAGISELVLDLRYNGGGLNDVANQLASQIGGDLVENQLFMSMVFNEQKSRENTNFYFDLGRASEVLDLTRVVILQTQSTCSASELVINSLSPYMEVVTIGGQSCGKPIGMYPTPICDDVVFAINFQTVNAAGFGDYFDGLPPTCPVEERIVGDWDEESDSLYQAAAGYLQTGQCPVDGANSHQDLPRQPVPLGIDWHEPWQKTPSSVAHQ